MGVDKSSLSCFIINGMYRGVHKRTRKRSPKRTRKKVPTHDSRKAGLSASELQAKMKEIKKANAKKRRKAAIEKKRIAIQGKKNSESLNLADMLWKSVKGDEFKLMSSAEMQQSSNKPIESNIKLHALVKHRYADESMNDIYIRLADYFKISPKVLYREVCALSGKFGADIIQPTSEDDINDIDLYIQSLRRAKFKIYTLIGKKMLRYTLMCITRYLRLGIPKEIRYRYILDLLNSNNLASACDLHCNHVDIYPITKYDQIYPDRVDFKPCNNTSDIGGLSDKIFYKGVEESKGWSPSFLVDKTIYSILTDKMKSQLVCLAAALNPKYTVQLVKNIAYISGYKNESELIRKFAFVNKFTSRGAKSYVLKLSKESAMANVRKKIEASPISNFSEQKFRTIYKPLVWRSIDRRKTSLRWLKKKLYNIRDEEEKQGILTPTLTDILKQQIERKILDVPKGFYKQAKRMLLGTRNLSSRKIVLELINRGFDPPRRPERFIDRKERIKIAKKMNMWINREVLINSDDSPPKVDEFKALLILDAASASAGFNSIRHLLALISMLSKPKTDKISKRIRQPGELGSNRNLKIIDFIEKLNEFN